ncbi:MAG: ABC transporter permease [Bryobacteraceae bacterium]
MSLWRQFIRGVRVLGNRTAADRDIADEVSHYLEEATASFVARGLSPEEARRAALRDLGSATAVRQEVRGYGWENLIGTFVADLRYAARRLRSNPGFTTVSLLVLALGIGATTVIFSVVEGVLLKPLPYPHSEQLVALRHTAPGLNIPDLNMAASLYFTYRDENRVFQNVAMWSGDSWTVTGIGEPAKVPGISVSDRFLATLEVQPALGRPFTTADENPDSERTVILANGYWRSRFAGDRNVVGRRILLDGHEYTIIGVLPASFQFMDWEISLIAPFRFRRTDIPLISFCCQGIARLKPSVTISQANADVARMLPIAPRKFPMNPGWSPNAFRDARIAPRLRPLKDTLVGNIGRTLWVLMGTVSIVLLIACANVANLLLVRMDGRRHELAIRTALGAGIGRIVQALLLESVLLSLCGGAIGLCLAYGALRILVISDVPNLPRIHEISMDPTVLVFAFLLSSLAGLLFGLIPAFKYSRMGVAGGLRNDGRSLTAGKDRQHVRGFLVAVQVALAVILLIGSGLMIRTFRALSHVDLGFSGARELQTIQIEIPETQVKDPKRVVRMEEAIVRKIETIPGVSAVAAISDLPLDGGENDPIYAEDHHYRESGVPAVRRFKYVSPGYISTVGSRLIAGRDFTWNELYNGTPVAIVSENLARELWGSPRAAISKHVGVKLKDYSREVIGVVADLHDDGIDQKAPTIVYWPLLQKNLGGGDTVIRGLSYIIRTPRAGSTALLPDLQRAVASVNPALPIADAKTLQSEYERSLSRSSLTLVLLAAAAGMALLLGLVGIYGVISYSVSQRTREIGIRLALGAPLRDVTRLFVRQGFIMCGVGVICGSVAAFTLTGLMRSLLFEVSPADPLTYVAASAGLMAAALLGSYLPARRAIKVDPVEALRAE